MSDFAFKPDPKLPQSGGISRKKPAGRRKAGSARWAQIREHKMGPCRVCDGLTGIQLHHLVPRAQMGSDTEANVVPLCRVCLDKVTRRDKEACELLRVRMTDEEYAYANERLGEDLFERYYPVRWKKP